MEILDEGIVSSKELLPTTDEMIPEVKEPAKLPEYIPNLDVCFMLDCTGSMQSYIDRAKNKIKDIIEEVKQQYPGSEVHVGFVGYRDFDTPQFDILQFTPNIPMAKDFITSIRASGGADCPEDVNGGFQKALYELKWSSQAKMIVHIADAPCHGKDFHSTGDTYPEGHKDDKPWETIFKTIVDEHMDYLFLKINNMTDKMFEKFKEMAEKLGAVDKGVLFKQEPISNIEQNASTGGGLGFGGGSLFGTATTLVPTTFKPAGKKRGAPKKERAVSKDKKEKPEKKTRSTSRKAAPKTKKEKIKAITKDEESDDEEVEDKEWVQPAYWTRSQAKQWKQRQDLLKGKKSPKGKGKKATKKDEEEEEFSGSGYWKIPVTPAKDTTTTVKVTSSRRKSVAKERERSAARDKKEKKEDAVPKKRGRKPKSEMSVERGAKKKVIKAPVSKALRKAPSFDMPSTLSGMSAMDEAEYFAKLLSKEMGESINRNKEKMGSK